MLTGRNLVETLHARALDATKLIDRPSLRSRLSESQVVHLPDDFETRVRVQCQARLMKQSIGSRSPRLTRGVETNASLAHPDEQAADPCGEGDGCMGGTGARLQHQASKTTDRDVRANAISIHDDEGAVQDIEPPFLDEQDGCTILDRNGARRSNPRRSGHGGQNLPVAGQGPTPLFVLLPGTHWLERSAENLPPTPAGTLPTTRKGAPRRSVVTRPLPRPRANRGGTSP